MAALPGAARLKLPLNRNRSGRPVARARKIKNEISAMRMGGSLYLKPEETNDEVADFIRNPNPVNTYSSQG